uniref:DNA alkylation repair enzyme n=1 Tax=Solibacter usitatus (strain Ellin6076) TaxID=234267 RepID=Q01V88_SOLUE
MTKETFMDLAYGLVLRRDGAIERCVEFILAETNGNWHGRARAMMCRRLKHCDVNAEQSSQLVSCITRRLTTGNFAEQFYDQLRLAMHLDQKSTFDIAQIWLASPKEHVRRFAAWILKTLLKKSESGLCAIKQASETALKSIESGRVDILYPPKKMLLPKKRLFQQRLKHNVALGTTDSRREG